MRREITIHAKLRGLMHGIGHAGDTLMKVYAHLWELQHHFPEGVERKLYLNLLSQIEAQAQQLKTTTDE